MCRGAMSAELLGFLFAFQSPAVTLRSTWFQSQDFNMALTMIFCVLFGSQNKRRILLYTALTEWFRIAEVKSVYFAVRTESYKTDTFRL
jgi:hypothetical protein